MSSTSNSSGALSRQQKNHSILSIPIVYALAFPPHLYAFARGMTASNYTYSNTVPRANLDLLKSKLPEATWQSLARAQGAHLNALEGFPLFAGAMIAGNYAKLPPNDLNFAAAEYICARVVYTALYMTTKSEAWSYLRTGVYAWSLAAPIWILWKAGKKIRDQSVDLKEL
ncbi:hypothetical protein LTR64_004006 [Lithohypha guttulata]|uniref:uncharacterized protein n=1 Tax=Lithohypha guttulata TaxID=1690604 RepID=UPI002DDF6DCA|nr:hypothetical protein LTR51_006699 [Lithohypha guttulata]